MFLRRLSGSGPFILSVCAVLSTACGSRSTVRGGQEEPLEPPPAACQSDIDCIQGNLCELHTCFEGACVLFEKVECGPARPCEENACNPATGVCETTPLTLDIDGDGHRAALPGTVPGSDGSCGFDCDDTNPLAFPGGVEACDGADNDCDGIIDNGSQYITFADDEVPDPVYVSSAMMASSGRRGLAFGDGVFALGYWGNTDASRPYLRGLDALGNEVFSETLMSEINGPTFGPSLTWTGNTFGAVWDDPRVDHNYEVYFARFDTSGNKLGPDLRLTEADDFSIHGRVLFDQGRYVVVWDDRRNEDTLGVTHLMAQLIDDQGEKMGDNLQLTPDDESAEHPYLAATATHYGVVYQGVDNLIVGLRFRAFSKDFAQSTEPVVIQASDVRGPRIAAAGSVFVVTWETYNEVPGPSVIGAVVNAAGQVLVGPVPLTTGATYQRSHGILSLGDRILLVWSDTLAGNYELYAKVLDLQLEELEPRRRLTEAEGDTLGAELALGDAGQVGVLFDDWRSGTQQTYFLTLGCEAQAPFR